MNRGDIAELILLLAVLAAWITLIIALGWP